MTGPIAEQELLNIVGRSRSRISKKLSELDVRQKTAIKAYKISLSMIDQAEKMVSMKFSAQPYDEKYYKCREDRVFRNPRTLYFSKYKNWYDTEENNDHKEAFLVYAHAVQMLRSSFLDVKTEELKKATSTNSVEAVFELKMIIDTLSDLLKEWSKWWQYTGGNIYAKKIK